MYFKRTAASIFQPVSEMSIEREREIAHLLQTYEAQQESAVCPDRTLLHQAKSLLEEKLAYMPLDRELVELGHSIYRSIGAWHQEIALLRQFLRIRPLSDDEQAWARWHIVDCLALAGNDHEAVSEQKAFYQWATSVFPLEDCFFVISDGTQAMSWFKIAQGCNWLSLHDQLSNQATRTTHNRQDRFYCLRTAVRLCLLLGERTRADHLISVLDMLVQEDPDWPERYWVEIEIAILEISLADRCGEVSRVRAVALKAMEQLSEWEIHLNTALLSEVGRFRSLCHNLAAPLYRGKHYDLAIPLLQKAVDYHTNPHYSYLWLAASLWQTTKEREKVLLYLRQAAARYDGEGNPWDVFQQLPEFENVRSDPEFLAAIVL